MIIFPNLPVTWHFLFLPPDIKWNIPGKKCPLKFSLLKKAKTLGYSKNSWGPMLKRQWTDLIWKYFWGSQTPSPNIAFFNKLNLSEHFFGAKMPKHIFLLFQILHYIQPHNAPKIMAHITYNVKQDSWSKWRHNVRKVKLSQKKTQQVQLARYPGHSKWSSFKPLCMMCN